MELILNLISHYSTWISLIAGLLAGGYLTLLFRTLQKHPESFTVALLGFPGSGKTMYITALFHELERGGRGTPLRFTPYGRDTIERISENLTTLSHGHWLPKTEVSSVFYFRANVSMGSGFREKRYKLEIGDYAGESMAELDPTAPAWLHKNDYFKYVVASDGVMLAVDAPSISNAPSADVERTQNALVAAFQVMAGEKGATDSRLLDTPVTLLFLKCDALPYGYRDVYRDPEDRLERLIDVCRSRCRNFKIFRASAVGSVGPNGEPPATLSPDGVVEPLVWLLRNPARASIASTIEILKQVMPGA